MLNSNNTLTSKIISLIIAVSFLMADISYAGAYQQGSLRVPMGDGHTLERVEKEMKRQSEAQPPAFRGNKQEIVPRQWIIRQMNGLEGRYLKAVSAMRKGEVRDGAKHAARLEREYRIIGSRIRSLMRRLPARSEGQKKLYKALDLSMAKLEALHTDITGLYKLYRAFNNPDKEKGSSSAAAILKNWQEGAMNSQNISQEWTQSLYKLKQGIDEIEKEAKRLEERLSEIRKKMSQPANAEGAQVEKIRPEFARMEKMWLEKIQELEAKDNRFNEWILSQIGELSNHLPLFERTLYEALFLDGHDAILLRALKKAYDERYTSAENIDIAAREILSIIKKAGTFKAGDRFFDRRFIVMALRLDPEAQKIIQREIGSASATIRTRAYLRRAIGAAIPVAASLPLLWNAVVHQDQSFQQSGKPKIEHAADARDSQKPGPTAEPGQKKNNQAGITISEAINKVLSETKQMSAAERAEAEAGLQKEKEEIDEMRERAKELRNNFELETYKAKEMESRLRELNKRGTEKEEKVEGKPELPQDWQDISDSASQGSGQTQVEKREALPKIKAGRAKVAQGPIIGNKWEARLEGQVKIPDLLAERNYTIINPLTGEKLQETLEWEQWGLHSGKATAWVTMRIDEYETLLRLAPDTVVVSVSAPNRRQAAVFFDRANRMWLIRGDIRGLVKIGIRDANKGELGELPRLKIMDSAKDKWMQNLPGPIQRIIEEAKPLPFSKRLEIKEKIIELFFYTQNPVLGQALENEPDFVTGAFKYYAFQCDGLTMVNAILSYSLDIPVFMQSGWSGRGGTFSSLYSHTWLYGGHGIDEALEYIPGSSRSSLHHRNVTPDDWKAEFEFIKERAEKINARLSELADSAKAELAADKREQEVKKKESAISNNIDPQKEEESYSDTLSKFRDSHEKLNIPGLSQDNALRLIGECLNFDLASIENNIQFMASGHFLFGVLKEIEEHFPQLQTNTLDVKRALFTKITEHSQKNNWLLIEPLSVPSKASLESGVPNDFRIDSQLIPTKKTIFVSGATEEHNVIKYSALDSIEKIRRELKGVVTEELTATGMELVERLPDGKLLSITTFLRQSVLVDLLSGERFEIGFSHMADYSQGTMVLRDNVGMDYLKGRKADVLKNPYHLGIRLYSTVSLGDDCLAVISIPSQMVQGHLFIGSLAQKAGITREEFEGILEGPYFSSNGYWMAKVRQYDGRSKIFKAGLIGYYPGNRDDVKMGKVNETFSHIAFSTKNGAWVAAAPEGNKYRLTGPLVDNTKIASQRFGHISALKFSPDGLKWIGAVEYEELQNGFIGPLAEEAGIVSQRFSGYIRDIYFLDDGWIGEMKMPIVYAGGQNPNVEYLHFAGTSKLVDKLKYVTVHEIQFAKDGSWIAITSPPLSGGFALEGPLADKVKVSNRSYYKLSHLNVLPNGDFFVFDQEKFFGPAAEKTRVDKLRFKKDASLQVESRLLSNGVIVVRIWDEPYINVPGAEDAKAKTYYSAWPHDYLLRVQGLYGTAGSPEAVSHLDARPDRLDLQWEYFAELLARDAKIAENYLHLHLIPNMKKYKTSPYFNPGRAVEIIKKNEKFFYSLGDNAALSFLSILPNTPLEYMILDILIGRAKPEFAEAFKDTHEKPVLTPELIGLKYTWNNIIAHQEERERITRSYIDFLKKKYRLTADYVPGFLYLDSERHAVSQLNTFLYEHEPRGSMAGYQEELNNLELFFKVLDRNNPGQFKRPISSQDLKAAFEFLRKETGLTDWYFDVEASPKARSNPLFKCLQLLRMNAPIFKFYGAPSEWVEYRAKIAKWQEINRKLNAILAGRFSGNVDMHYAWNDFYKVFQEARHDAVVWAEIFGILYLILSYKVSRPALSQDKWLTGRNAADIIKRILQDNPWLRGRRADVAMTFLASIISSARKLTEPEIVEIEAFRSSISRKEQAIFDLIRVVVTESPQDALKQFRIRWLSLIPFLSILTIRDPKQFRKRQEMNKKLGRLADSLQEGRTPEAFYKELRSIIEEFSPRGQVSVEKGTREPPKDFETTRKQLHDDITAARHPDRIRIVVVPKVTAVSGRHNGAPARKRGQSDDFIGHRAYIQGDAERLVDWNATARLNTTIVKDSPREVLNPAVLLIDMRSAFNQVLRQDWLDDIGRSCIAFFEKNRVNREGEKYLSLDKAVFILPGGKIKTVAIKQGKRQYEALITQLSRAYLEAYQGDVAANSKIPNMARVFLNAEENSWYVSRTKGVLDISAQMEKELAKAFAHKAIRGSVVFLAGVSGSDRAALAEIAARNRIRGLWWDGNIARPLQLPNVPTTQLPGKGIRDSI